jgi:NADH-quinone oxidoreductase subunit N
MWTPDVYEGAPTPVTAFFASAPKVAAMALLTRVAVEAMGPATFEWRQIVIFMALASTILGGVAAIGQPNIKRLLAYSSINNVGFALIGLAAGTREGVASVLFYMAVYVVMTLGSFLVVLRMRDSEGRPVESIASLCPACRVTRPWLAWHGDLHVQPRRRPAAVRLLAQIPGLRRGGPGRPHLAGRGRHRHLGDQRLLLSEDRQDDVFRRAGPGLCPTRDVPQAVLIVLAALFVSPLGYLAIPYLAYLGKIPMPRTLRSLCAA